MDLDMEGDWRRKRHHSMDRDMDGDWHRKKHQSMDWESREVNMGWTEVGGRVLETEGVTMMMMVGVRNM